jgi:TolB-like protein/lipopolysaccharide biosynthesis regulator YciM
LNSRNFLTELKRRNVYKVAVAYAVVSWLLIQIATQVFPFFEIPNWAVRLVVLLLILGFPVTLVLAWAFEITPEGIKRADEVAPEQSITRRTGRKLIGITVAIAVAGAGMFAAQFIRPRLMRASAPTPVALTAAAPIPEKSIAVLPFENLSDNKQNSYFADGVQDEILTDLAKVADLKVISRTSVMQYRKSAARNLREIGRQLGVAHVLEGSVQREGNKVRVNAQLIDARNDAHLWAHTYDRNLSDVFAIQSEIAETIAGQLQAELSPREKAAIAQAPTTDVVANDLYIRARLLDESSNDPGGEKSMLEAVTLAEEAVRRDPNFLLAYCLLCEIHLDLYWGGFDHTTARRDQAFAALQAAERIQPDNGEVHIQKAIYAYHGFRDYDTARAECEKARETLPNSSRVPFYLGVIDRRQARWDESLRNFDRAIELDPRFFPLVEEAAFTYGGLDRYEEAETLLKRAIALAPKDYFARTLLALYPFYERGDLGPLREQLDRFRAEGPEATSNAADAFIQYALARRDLKAAEEALTFVPETGLVNTTWNFLQPRGWFVGLVEKTLGDPEKARQAFSEARGIVAKTAQKQPNYAPAQSVLGLIDAGLGRKAEAIAEGKRACELLPLSKDSWEGPSYVSNLAIIYTWLGEKDSALAELAISTSHPAGIRYGELKLEPFWDSLRQDPRFQKIVASVPPHAASKPGAK